MENEKVNPVKYLNKENGIYKAIIEVMRLVGAISKEQENKAFGAGYKFRGVDDVYNALHSHHAKIGIFALARQLDRSEERYKSQKGGDMIRVVLKSEYDFVFTDGSFVTVGPIFTESNDSSDKATNKCASVAHRTALLQLYMIPTEEPKDADNDSPQNPPIKIPTSRPTPISSAPPKAEISKTGPFGISEAQIKRLYAIQKNQFASTGHWTADDVKNFIQAKIGKESSKLLTKKEYDGLIEAIQTKTPEEAFS